MIFFCYNFAEANTQTSTAMIRKTCFLFLITMISSVLLYGATDEIVLRNADPQHNHFVAPPTPADMPQVYYDDETDEIIIDGPGYASYYNVDIVSQSTLALVLYDTVDGDYDTIDISSLPDDNYEIIVTSSNNNEFVGYFTNY